MLFAGLVVFMFLIIIRPQDFVPGLAGLPLVFGLMAVLSAGWIFSPVQKKLFRAPQDRFITVLFCMIVISTLSVRWVTYTVDMAVETLKLALIYFFIVTLVNTEGKFRAITWIILFFMTLVALMGIAQYYGHDITGIGMSWAPDKEVWQIRGIGNFDNPNDMAYSVILVLPFMLGLLLSGRFYLKPVALITSIIIIYCIYLTKSRGGQLALAVSLAVWFYFWTENRVFRKVCLLAGFVITLFVARHLVTGYQGDASSMGRVEAWAKGMDLLTEHPLIGTGKGQFIEYHERDSHNSYVRAGAELGLPGLYTYLGLIYACFRTLMSPMDRKWKIYRAGYMGFLVSYTVASLFSTRTYDIIFWIVAGFIGILGRFAKQENPDAKAIPDIEFFNMKLAGILFATLVIWKIFLIQAW